MNYIVECVKSSLNYIMKSLLYLSIVVYFYPASAFPRSLPFHSIIPKDVVIEKKLDLDSKSTGRVWTRFKSSRLGDRHDEGAGGKDFNTKSLETKSINSNAERLVNDIRMDITEEKSTEANIRVKGSVDAQNNETMINFDIKQSTTDMSDIEVLTLQTDPVSNFSDSVMLTILDLTKDVVTLQTSTESINVTESFTLDGATLSESKTSLEDSVPGIGNLNSGNDTEGKLQEILINGLSDSFDTKVDKNETKNELKEGDSKDVGTELVIAQNGASKCPEPGWCIFWFLAQDTCAEDSHCLGSRICCLWGCSNTCIDID